MDRYFAAWALVGMLTVAASAELNTRPAARIHVRLVDGVPMRFSSKLSHVVELNFTLNFHHTIGKAIIDQTLDRIAVDYSLGGEAAFAVKKFLGPGNGGGAGLPITAFTLDDLLASEVIVTNNVSNLNDLPAKNMAEASALETAIRERGRSVLGFHASGDGGPGWGFYTNELHPLLYTSMGNQSPQPVYKNEADARHLVLEGVLESGTEKQVPMGTDSEGKQVLKPAIIRMMNNEWLGYNLDILSDPKYIPLSTCLLRFDPRSIASNDFPGQYRFPGGNAFSFILKVGAGKSGYIPSGHSDNELTTGNGFDGGTGDFERYFAQMLFFLAGYTPEACGGAVECEGLPVVDSLDHMTGVKYSGVDALFEQAGSAIGFPVGKPYRTTIVDLRGRIVAAYAGKVDYRSRRVVTGLAPGVYFVSLRGGNAKAQVRRIIVPPSVP